MSVAFIGLGANLGDPIVTVGNALRDLGQIDGIRLLQQSSLYGSKALGPGSQPDYVNAVAQVQTTHYPHDLLDVLLALEARHGRVRDGQRWGPRTLDLDLLLYAELQLNDYRLTLPHPEIKRRNFVLVPLLELVPDLRIPGQGSARALLDQIGTAGLMPLDLPADTAG